MSYGPGKSLFQQAGWLARFSAQYSRQLNDQRAGLHLDVQSESLVLYREPDRYALVEAVGVVRMSEDDAWWLRDRLNFLLGA